MLCYEERRLVSAHRNEMQYIISSQPVMSHQWAITCGERRDTVQLLCRCLPWGPGSTAIADVLDRRINVKSPCLVMIQLPVIRLGFCRWQRLHAYCKYLHCTKPSASPLGYAHTFMGVHIKSFFPTSPHSWLIFLTCLSPNLISERSQLVNVTRKTGRLSVVRRVWTKPVPLRHFVSSTFRGWGLAGCAMQPCGRSGDGEREQSEVGMVVILHKSFLK